MNRLLYQFIAALVVTVVTTIYRTPLAVATQQQISQHALPKAAVDNHQTAAFFVAAITLTNCSSCSICFWLTSSNSLAKR
jgi:hypothetical protein